jgi:hypothetical protein
VPVIWSRSRRRLVRFFIMGMLWMNLLFFLDVREGMRFPDFTIFYTAGKILRQGLGRQLYDKKIQYAVQESFTGHLAFRLGPLPYNHPPFEAPIFVPLTLLSYQQAFAVWDLLNVVALFGVALVLRRSVAALNALPLWKFVVASIAFFPIFACLLQGQDSILHLLLCCLAFHALKKNEDMLGGCWLALAAFRFQFIVPLVLLFLIWGRRRIVAGFGAGAAVLGLISTGLVGVRTLLQYPGYVMQIANSPGLGGIPPEFLPNLHGLAMGWHALLSDRFGAALAVVGSVGVFLFAAWAGRAPARVGKFELQFSLAVLVSVLIAWQTNVHDHSLLILPVVLVADYCLRAIMQTPARRFRLLLPVLPLLISPLWMVLWLVLHDVNLIAIPLLWWTWRIGREIAHAPGGALDGVAHDTVAR